MTILNVANPAAPTIVSAGYAGCYEPIGPINRITTNGASIIVAAGNGVFVISAAAPLEVRQLPFTGAWSAAVVGEYVYVAAGQEGLYILRLENDG